MDKIRATNANAPKIKTLGFEIRQLFENEIKSRVRSAATGNNANLWQAVKRSKNINSETIPANALRSCLMTNALDISFENIHKNNKKCTPNQIMLYQISLKLFKVINDTEIPIKTETIRAFDQIISTRRQMYVVYL